MQSLIAIALCGKSLVTMTLHATNSPYVLVESWNRRLSILLSKLINVLAAVDQPFRFPAAFTFVLRAFSTLEGLGELFLLATLTPWHQ